MGQMPGYEEAGAGLCKGVSVFLLQVQGYTRGAGFEAGVELRAGGSTTGLVPGRSRVPGYGPGVTSSLESLRPGNGTQRFRPSSLFGPSSCGLLNV